MKILKNPMCQFQTLLQKNPAYGRHQISWQMRKEAQIFFCKKKKKSIRNDSLFLRLYALVHKCTSPPAEDLPDVDLQQVQSETTPRF